MKHVDFLKLDNAINGLIIEETNTIFEKNPNDMMFANGLYVNEVYDEKNISQNDRIHQIDVNAIRNAIKSAVSNKKKNTDVKNIKVSPSAGMSKEKKLVAVKPQITYEVDAFKPVKLSAIDIVGLAEFNNYNKNYFFDGENPFCIYDPSHNKFISTIYSLGIIDAENIVKNNVSFRNIAHFSPKCSHVKDLIKKNFKSTYDNNFEINCNGTNMVVNKMPLCDECCKIINIPNLSENPDFISMFSLAVSISK